MLSPRKLTLLFWTLTAALLGAAMIASACCAPADSAMGPMGSGGGSVGVAKIFYIHLPVAMNTFLACGIVFIASIGYIWQRKPWWDRLAGAAGLVAVLYCSVLLLTGMIWARDAWGHWWMWSPRLTFSLMLWLLFVAYIVVRRSIRDPLHRGVACAAYGIIAFLDVPLVYLSVRLLPDVHPANIQLTPAMRATLLVWFLPVTMICAGLILARSGFLARVFTRVGEDGHRFLPWLASGRIERVDRRGSGPGVRSTRGSPSPASKVAPGFGRTRTTPRI
jgi:heme exporter protein C